MKTGTRSAFVQVSSRERIDRPALLSCKSLIDDLGIIVYAEILRRSRIGGSGSRITLPSESRL